VSTKPGAVFAREVEWAALNRLVSSDRPELAFALGRRRVGKSFVLSRWSRANGGIYYQATRQTEAEQLAQLSGIVGAHFGEQAMTAGVSFPSWDALLGYLAQRAAAAPVLLCLDEFPFLADAAPALPSLIQRLWDHDAQGTRLKLVLSGSFVTAMRALEGADQPLYGRRTAKLFFQPFDLPAATRFVPRWSPIDQLTAYATFGHLPGHLARIDATRTVGENVAASMLDPAGPLVDDAEHALDAFLADARVHYSVLQAVADGAHTWSGISSRVGQTGGSLSRPMAWLEEMGLLERVVPITERNPRRSKRALYRIADPHLGFWHHYVSPLIRTGTVGLVEPSQLWTRSIEPRLSGHLGPVFEAQCRDFARRPGALPFQPLRVGEWWDAHGQAQVDVVAVDESNLFVAEAKWGHVGRAHLSRLRERSTELAHALGVSKVHLGLFSATGQRDSAVEAAVQTGEVHWYTAETLCGG
jgi:uncharacterized protein